MNKKVLFGVLVGVLVLAIAGVGYAAFRVARQGDEQQRRADVIAGSRAVDAKLDALWERMETSDAAWEASAGDPDVDSATVTKRADDDVADMTAMVAEARTLVADIPDDEVKAKYEGACASLESMLEEGTAASENAAAASEANKLVLAAFDDDKTGTNALNESIRLCNKKKYSDAKAEADKALKAFKALKTKLVNANKAYECSQVRVAYRYPDAAIKLAQMQRELAVLGSNGSVNGYNAQISKLEKQRGVVASQAVEFDIASDTLAKLVEGLYGNFTTRAKEAKTFWDAAKELVASGSF